MTEFFEGMDVFLKTLWIMAAIASPILVFQMISTFMGMDATDGVDVEIDGDVGDFEADDAEGEGGHSSFQLWTLRNYITFITVFAWTGIVCKDNGLSNGWSTAWATLLAVAMVFIVTAMFYGMSKLQADNTPKLKSAIGKVAVVYIRIPENGAGKITVSIGGSTREVSARAKDGKAFQSNDRVKVLEYDGDEYVVDNV